MKCPYCNADLPNGAQGCTYCGNWFGQNQQSAPGMGQQYGVPPIMPTTSQYCGKAIASFVLSLVGILIAGLIMGILGIVFGALALNEIKSRPYLQGKGLATAGLVISIIDCVFMFVFIALLL